MAPTGATAGVSSYTEDLQQTHAELAALGVMGSPADTEDVPPGGRASPSFSPCSRPRARTARSA